MNVGTISLVGITVVFFTFLVLFFLFKLLARLFGDRKTPEQKGTPVSKKNREQTQQTETKQPDLELIAVITAAIASHTTKNVKIKSIKEKTSTKGIHWKAQTTKIWRPLRKGVKRTW